MVLQQRLFKGNKHGVEKTANADVKNLQEDSYYPRIRGTKRKVGITSAQEPGRF